MVFPRLDAGMDVVLQLVRIEVEQREVRVGALAGRQRFVAQILQHHRVPLLAGDIAEQVTERVNHLTTLQQIKTPDMPLSLSSGFATARDVKQMADLFRRADDAMYRLRYRRRSKEKESLESNQEGTAEH